jgi:hypothetical protein
VKILDQRQGFLSIGYFDSHFYLSPGGHESAALLRFALQRMESRYIEYVRKSTDTRLYRPYHAPTNSEIGMTGTITENRIYIPFASRRSKAKDRRVRLKDYNVRHTHRYISALFQDKGGFIA